MLFFQVHHFCETQFGLVCIWLTPLIVAQKAGQITDNKAIYYIYLRVYRCLCLRRRVSMYLCICTPFSWVFVAMQTSGGKMA